MMNSPRHILLLQLPIPPPGPVAIRGNVPLAAGYLKMLAGQRGLARDYRIDIFPADLANRLSDQALVEAILKRDPWLVGFTCYLWNIERTLWSAEQLKARRSDIKILLGGPEITADNNWVLAHRAIDFAAIGEGEQTFCELLAALGQSDHVNSTIDGLYVRQPASLSQSNDTIPAGLNIAAPIPPLQLPNFRRPLAHLDEISSPYLCGILDAAEEEMLLLETIRGCVFKCKFCYYPKSYDALYFLSDERLVANLQHAQQRKVKEVVLLDPTLNQRRDFAGFLKLLADFNPQRKFTYFGELRAEGINAEIAGLLQAANFTEVEIGLQSIDARAQELMDRKNHLQAFERGVQALLQAGIKVKVDLIIGLPGDTVDSIRRGMDYLLTSGLYSTVQVFNLAILPGTTFRQEAHELGLEFQPRPPYYVTRTPTLELSQMLELMDEAQQAFGVEFDPLPEPKLEFAASDLLECRAIDLDEPAAEETNERRGQSQAFTLWFRSAYFHAERYRAAEIIEQLLKKNPFTTLQVVLEPKGDPHQVTLECLERLARACFQNPTYLDKFYAVLPGRPKGAKRLIVVLPIAHRARLSNDWIDAIGNFATLAWRGEQAVIPEAYDCVIATDVGSASE